MFKSLPQYLTLDQNFTKYRHVEYSRRLRLLYWISILGSVALIPYALAAIYRNSRLLGLIDLTVAAVLLVNALAARGYKLYRANIWVGIMCLMVLYTYTFVTGGVNQTGFVWHYIFPPVALFLLGSNLGLIVSLLMLVPAVVLFSMGRVSPPLAFYGTEIAIRFTFSYLLVVYFSYLFERDHERNCDALGELQEGLERRVADRTHALTLANAKLVREMAERQALQTRIMRIEKMEAVGNLVGGVAHDLNNILSGLVAYPEVILATLPKDSSLRQPMLTIKKTGERAAAIVSDMLYMARGGGVALHAQNLNEIVSEYLGSLELGELLRHHPGVEVESDLAADLLPMNGASGHLSKIVMNLVTNAVEATAASGRVRVETGNRSLETTVNGYDDIPAGDYVTLTISDSGSGISAQDMTRIFEPFFTRKTLGRSGTGLGLAVVWSAVKDLHGFIDVESRAGRGTSFTLYFPVVRPGSAAGVATSADLKGHGETLLVVDDIDDQREMAKSILEALGYSVLTASNGREALSQAGLTKVDLVVLDMLEDSDLDGRGIYRELVKINPGQKIIIVGGVLPDDRVREMQRMGAGPFVPKPYLLETIGPAVRQTLDGES
jgi:signal transduction histidine kinase/CheY-like chemotaxis protein